MRVLFFCMVLVVLPTLVNATNADQTLQEIERLQRANQREKQLEKIKKSFEKKEIKPEKITPKIDKNAPCFTINQFVLEGATHMPPAQQEKLFAPYKNTCVSITMIDALMRQITQWYIEQGYVTTRAYIPQQNLKSGTLKFRVIEGKIERIILNENTPKDQRRVWTAFPVRAGDEVVLKEIERGIDQLKIPQSSDAGMTIEPGTQTGQSILRVKTIDDRPYRFKIGYDNLGQKSTGKDRLSMTAGIDNLFSLNETITLMVIRNADFMKNDHGSEAYLAQYSMPFGNWRSNIALSHSRYNTTSTGSFGIPMETSGDSTKFTWDAEYLLFRNRQMSLNLTGGLSHYDSNAYIFDAENPASTYDLTSLNFGANMDFAWKGAYFMTDANIERGISWFDANSDKDIANYSPHARFRKYSLSITGMKDFKAGDKNFRFISNLFAQYSPDTLHPAKKIIIGDRYSVRGFRKDSGYGNSGFFIQNDIFMDLNTKKLDRLQLFAGIDGGIVSDVGNTEELMGVAVGLKAEHKGFEGEITLGCPIYSPDEFDENHAFYVTLSKRF